MIGTDPHVLTNLVVVVVLEEEQEPEEEEDRIMKRCNDCVKTGEEVRLVPDYKPTILLYF